MYLLVWPTVFRLLEQNQSNKDSIQIIALITEAEYHIGSYSYDSAHACITRSEQIIEQGSFDAQFLKRLAEIKKAQIYIVQGLLEAASQIIERIAAQI